MKCYLRSEGKQIFFVLDGQDALWEQGEDGQQAYSFLLSLCPSNLLFQSLKKNIDK